VWVMFVVSHRTRAQTISHNEAPASSGKEKEAERGHYEARARKKRKVRVDSIPPRGI
jgi:hypothetical protein